MKKIWKRVCTGILALTTSTYGNPRSKGFHQKYYKDLLKSLDLPDIHFHQLRNTYATILLKNSFNSTYGNPRSKGFHQKYYKDLLKSLDLPDIHFHQLRNTYATILLKNSFNSVKVFIRNTIKTC